jgi:D-amino-acid oxidase
MGLGKARCGGISSLTTAVRLLEAPHEVIMRTAQPPEQTTSSLAAAIWYPPGLLGA